MAIPTPAAKLKNPRFISPRRADFGPVDLHRLAHVRNTGRLRWSADGRSIYFESDISGRLNIWMVPAQGGWPIQMTFADDATYVEDPSPDGKWLLYTQDTGGNEKPNIFRMPAVGGPPTQLTHTENVSYWSIHWTPDSRYITFVAELEKPGQYQAYRMDADGHNVELLAPATPEGLVADAKLSPDGRYLALVRTHDFQHDGIAILDTVSGKERWLIPIPKEGFAHFIDWDPSGRFLLIVSNLTQNGMSAPGLLDIQTGHVQWLSSSAWDTTPFSWSSDGRYISYAENVAGEHQLYLYDVKERKSVQLPLAGGWVWGTRFSPDNTRLAVHYTSADQPSDIWVVPLDTLEAGQRTYSFVAGLTPENFVRPYVVTYPSFDGTTIAALLYLPPNLKRDGSNKAIVYIHGGPAWQSVNRWVREISYLVTRGYIIIAPNYRGSTGFGRAFEEANRGDLGGGDLKDVVAAVDYLKETGYVDSEHIAVMGGSYGGYLTMMAITKYPDLWAAAVAIVPFVNWFTEYENEDEVLKAYDRMMMGDPQENADLWRDRSPIFFIDRVKAPLLLLAGENDIRCPAEETKQVVDALQRRGIPVEAKIYPHEGHRFQRREHQLDALRRIGDFLARYL